MGAETRFRLFSCGCVWSIADGWYGALSISSWTEFRGNFSVDVGHKTFEDFPDIYYFIPLPAALLGIDVKVFQLVPI